MRLNNSNIKSCCTFHFGSQNGTLVTRHRTPDNLPSVSQARLNTIVIGLGLCLGLGFVFRVYVAMSVRILCHLP